MNRALLLLLAWLWAAPAWALDWFATDQDEAQAIRAALEDVWPGGEVTVRVGEPPAAGDAAWAEGVTLVLRLDGRERRAQDVPSASTRVVLVRSWIESSEAPLPSPPAPVPAPASIEGGVCSLHGAHLLPGAGSEAGLEIGIGAVGTGSLDSDPIEGATEGYAPVVDVAAGIWRLRGSATVWNTLEGGRSHRPMVLGGLSVLAVDRERWRLAPWVGVAGGWKLAEAVEPVAEVSSAFAEGTRSGFAGVMGAGLGLEVDTERLTWDLSLPLLGWMTWMNPDESRTGRVALLLPYPEAGVSWRLTDADTMRFGLLASVPGIRWRHDWSHVFLEASAATSLGVGELGDGDLLLGAALQGRVGVTL